MKSNKICNNTLVHNIQGEEKVHLTLNVVNFFVKLTFNEILVLLSDAEFCFALLKSTN